MPYKGKGGIAFDSNASKNLPIQTKLHILGFPAGQGVKKEGSISPIYSTAVTARQGLEDNGTIKTAGKTGTTDENRHAWFCGYGTNDVSEIAVCVMIEKGGKYSVIGILSGANVGSASMKGRVVPIGNAL